MKGVVIEVRGLKNAKHLNTKRGIIDTIISKDPLKFQINIDEMSYIIKNENVLKVYCLGIPREYRLIDTCQDGFKFFLAAISQVKSVSFYVLLKTHGFKTSVFIINSHFFSSVLDKASTEPLLRIYSRHKSQNESNIVFDQCCVDISEDMSYPWYFDMSSHELMQLIARFDMEDKEESVFKQMNIHDFKNGMFSNNLS